MDLQTNKADDARLAQLGVSPELWGKEETANAFIDLDENSQGCASSWVALSAAEIEILLCFALTSPLHFGPGEERICDKLRTHLRGAYRLHLAPAPIE